MPLFKGILGFETGYSYSSPHCLAIWEAQYGDFADTGQAMFDTFICNGESKWICQSGVVMQLPHGIDGAVSFYSSPFRNDQSLKLHDSLIEN